MVENQYDVIIIGSGPGGYVSAIRCSQLGLKVAIIEKYPTLGGTCLNVGCMPSKALLDSSEHYYNAKNNFSKHGISTGNLEVSIEKMIGRKADVVKKIHGGVAYLMKKNKIDVIQGLASFIAPKIVKIETADGKLMQFEAKNFIVATGSKPASLPFIKLDKTRIITSTEALSLTEIPKHLIIIGGGVIGVELGSVYARLGAKASVIEFTDSILATMDRAIGKELQKSLGKTGLEFYLNHKVIGAENLGESVKVTAEDKAGQTVTFEGDYCLVSIGRKPYTENLGADNAGINIDEKGRIVVDENLQTTAPGVYAIGDVTRGPMLAHKASEEGIFVAEHICNQRPHINYRLIPGIVYTWPEAASVGFTEEELQSNKVNYKSGIFPFSASGRAITSDDTEGFVKILANKETDEILGVHIVGPRASDFIGEATLAMEYKASGEDIARTSHGHPTYYEALKEAAMALGDGAIHF